jgi:hypothetical protein
LATSHTHQELVVAADVDIHPVAAAERNFLVQLHEAAGSEISLELQLGSSHTHQELVVAADVDIHPVVAAPERKFLVQPHEVAGSESSLKAVQAGFAHQAIVAAGIDRIFVVELHEAAGSESSLEAFQSASATRQQVVVAARVDIHTVAAAAERNFVLTQLHEASREPKMRLMSDLMNPAEEEAAVAPTTKVLESLEASLIHMNPEAASPHGHVDEPAEEHEQQLLQAATHVNLINSPAAHTLTHELHHHDAHDIDTPRAQAAATGKKIVFNSSGPASNVKHAHDELQ